MIKITLESELKDISIKLENIKEINEESSIELISLYDKLVGLWIENEDIDDLDFMVFIKESIKNFNKLINGAKINNLIEVRINLNKSIQCLMRNNLKKL